MSKYTLHYFPLRARGEAMRYMFAYRKQPFVDHRIDFADWPTEKAKMPSGTLPVLDVDKKRFSESIAIMRYLGFEFELVGANNAENARLDAVVDFTNSDIISDIPNKWFPENDPTKKEAIAKKLREETHPAKFNALVGSVVSLARI